ncbi:DUF3283 family protein [Aeromonas hydrophila]|uniref:DUF3283 family protein n=1 Tax=Aeromonas hydrophila TaxID=644 RepID=UPI0005747F03|nr:DUF3283 family protein [Aeromonas hydrophila]KHN59940.1 hypothetical protein OI72_05355 [Aeromonas hydrophila]OFC42757.1 hypothetical protein BA189_04385 [Aeromonas hydrophila]OFC52653.1 hypothetical protein BA188_11695 [Aeromonas hydrophila]
MPGHRFVAEENQKVSYNLALLPPIERRRIELIKQAHLLMWKRRRGQIGRDVVVAAIEDVEDENREWFRERLNEIKSQEEATPSLRRMGRR